MVSLFVNAYRTVSKAVDIWFKRRRWKRSLGLYEIENRDRESNVISILCLPLARRLGDRASMSMRMIGSVGFIADTDIGCSIVSLLDLFVLTTRCTIQASGSTSL